MKRQILTAIQILFAIVILTAILVNRFDRIVVKPSDHSLLILPFSDTEDLDTLCSQTLLFEKSDERVRFHYKLDTTVNFPYIGFGLEDTTKAWNISRLNKITVEIEPNLTDNFTLLLSSYIDGFTDSSDGITYRLFEYDIDEISSAKTTLNIADFKTPTWWFEANSINANNNRKSLHKTTQIRFQSHPLAPTNSELRIQVKSITFHHSQTRTIPLVISSFFVIILCQIAKRKREIPFIPVSVPERSSEEIELIEEFIGKEFSRLDMSLQKVVQETGLSETVIRSQLKKFHKVGFKEYLNGIRMTEGARLLCESDRQISEIALYVGFRHPTTFTKIFRDRFKLSPREYREKNNVNI